MIAGSTTAASLTINSAGVIIDNTGTSIVVSGNASITAVGNISLADEATDVLSVGGNASFNSGATLAVGNAAFGTANFGTLMFFGAKP